MSQKIIVQDGNLTFDAVTGEITLSSGAGTGTSAGSLISITAGASGTGASATGGALDITGGGSASDNGVGGAVQIFGGSGSGNPTVGGAVTVQGGTGNLAGTGGLLTLKGGNSGNAVGGAVTIQGGDSNNAGTAAGVSILGADGGSGATVGGPVAITGGTPPTAGVGGTVTITTGDGGSPGGGAGGLLTLAGGDGFDTSAGGAIDITAGTSGAGATGTGGGITITGGLSAATNGAGGVVTITAGAGAGTGAGGAFSITAGNSGTGATGTGGSILIDAGDGVATAGIGGGIDIFAGTGVGATSSETGGDIRIIAGAITGSGGAIAGNVTIAAGSSTTAQTGGGVILRAGQGTAGGGEANLIGGQGQSNASGGGATSTGGQGAGTGNGGLATLRGGIGGSGLTGNGGNAIVDGGNSASTNGDGGDINLTVGSSTGSGADGIVLVTGTIEASNAAGWTLLDEAPTSTNPIIIPNKTDTDTGIGQNAVDELSIIVGGQEGLRLTELNSGIVQAPAADVTITAFATGGQASATALKQSYNVLSVVATTGDSVKLPDTFAVNSVIYVKNDGANSADIFPSLGDDLGAGLNLAVAVGPGELKSFIATVANSTWTQLVVAPSAPVDLSGTPVNNQIAVWTDANTIEGDPNFTWDGSHLLLPQFLDAVTPTLAFGDGDTGFFESTDDNLKVSIAGSTAWQFIPSGFFGGLTGAPGFRNILPTATIPNILIRSNTFSTGIGSKDTKNITIIADSVVGIGLTGLNSGVLQDVAADVTITAFATGGQGSAIALKQSYNVLGTVATTGDSVKLPAVFAANSLIYIKNDGANSADVFPATGDNLGAGLNIAIAVAAGESVTFIATVANATWTPFIVSAGVPDPLLLSDGTAGAPSYSFVNAPTSGLFRPSANKIEMSIAGTSRFLWDANFFMGKVANAPLMQNVSSSATVPNFLPSNSDLNTGLGRAGTDQLSLIAGGVEGIRVTAAAGLITIPTFGPISAPVGTAALPSYSFAASPTTGIFSAAANRLSISVAGDFKWQFRSNNFESVVGNGPIIVNEAATATNPTLIPHAGAVETGIGANSPTELSLIAGSVEVIRCVNTAGIDQAIMSPGIIVNDPLTPTLAFGDGDTGFFETTDDNFRLSVAGAARVGWSSTGYFSNSGGGFQLLYAAPSATVPSLLPNGSDVNTGIGRANTDQLSLIAGGVEGLRLTELNSGVVQVPAADVAITAFATGGQASATALKQSYNVLGTVATTGDSVKLPDVFAINSIIFVKNNGANSADVFPATGDDLGAGLNTAVAVAAGESLAFITTVANATWTQLFSFGGGGVPDPLLLSDGVLGAPTYSFTSDPDTGIFLDGAGILSFTTGGFKIARTQDGGVGARQFIVAPTTFQNNPAAPSLAFGDGDTGLFESADDNLVVSIAGTDRYFWSGNVYGGLIGTSAAILNEVATATNPTVVPNRGDLDTGLGQNAVNKFSLIAFGIEVARVTTVAGPTSQFIIAPGVVQDTAGTPSLAFGDGDSGFYETSDDVLALSLGNIEASRLEAGIVTTTDATVTEILATSVTSGSSIGFEIHVMGTQDSTGDSVFERIFGAIRNQGGTTALIGSTITDRTDDAGATTWTIAVAADDTTDELTVDVTGEAAHTIDWKVRVHLLNV